MMIKPFHLTGFYCYYVSLIKANLTNIKGQEALSIDVNSFEFLYGVDPTCNDFSKLVDGKNTNHFESKEAILTEDGCHNGVLAEEPTKKRSNSLFFKLNPHNGVSSFRIYPAVDNSNIDDNVDLGTGYGWDNKYADALYKLATLRVCEEGFNPCTTCKRLNPSNKSDRCSKSGKVWQPDCAMKPTPGYPMNHRYLEFDCFKLKSDKNPTKRHVRLDVKSQTNFGWGNSVFSRPGFLEIEAYGHAQKCECDNGVGADLDQCPNGEKVCQDACDTGFNFNADEKTCTGNTCICPLGEPATGAECTEEGAELCLSCSDTNNYYLENNRCKSKATSCLDRMFQNLETRTSFVDVSQDEDGGIIVQAREDSESGFGGKFGYPKLARFNDLSITSFTVDTGPIPSISWEGAGKDMDFSIGWSHIDKVCPDTKGRQSFFAPGKCVNGGASGDAGVGMDYLGQVWYSGARIKPFGKTSFSSSVNKGQVKITATRERKDSSLGESWSTSEFPDIKFLIEDDSGSTDFGEYDFVASNKIKNYFKKRDGTNYLFKHQNEHAPAVGLGNKKGSAAIKITAATCINFLDVITCSCAGGVAKTEEQGCTGGENCQSCDEGYDLSEDNLCVPKQCVCQNGEAAIGVDCPVTGEAKCASCDYGFLLNVNGQNLCTDDPSLNVCICNNGTPVAENICSADGANECASCDSGYTLESEQCVANVCTCQLGVVATGEACTGNGLEKCASCNEDAYMRTYDMVCQLKTIDCVTRMIQSVDLGHISTEPLGSKAYANFGGGIIIVNPPDTEQSGYGTENGHKRMIRFNDPTITEFTVRNTRQDGATLDWSLGWAPPDKYCELANRQEEGELPEFHPGQCESDPKRSGVSLNSDGDLWFEGFPRVPNKKIKFDTVATSITVQKVIKETYAEDEWPVIRWIYNSGGNPAVNKAKKYNMKLSKKEKQWLTSRAGWEEILNDWRYNHVPAIGLSNYLGDSQLTISDIKCSNYQPPATCTCNFGVATSGEACPGGEHCATCDASHYMTEENTCERKQCTCANGSTTAGVACAVHDTEFCIACNDGWLLDGETNTCVDDPDTNTCFCDNGTPPTGAHPITGEQRCPGDGMHVCQTCIEGYYQYNVGGMFQCVPNECTCLSGLGGEGAIGWKCPEDGGEYCVSCAQSEEGPTYNLIKGACTIQEPTCVQQMFNSFDTTDGEDLKVELSEEWYIWGTARQGKHKDVIRITSLNSGPHFGYRNAKFNNPFTTGYRVGYERHHTWRDPFSKGLDIIAGYMPSTSRCPNAESYAPGMCNSPDYHEQYHGIGWHSWSGKIHYLNKQLSWGEGKWARDKNDERFIPEIKNKLDDIDSFDSGNWPPIEFRKYDFVGTEFEHVEASKDFIPNNGEKNTIGYENWINMVPAVALQQFHVPDPITFYIEDVKCTNHKLNCEDEGKVEVNGECVFATCYCDNGIPMPSVKMHNSTIQNCPYHGAHKCAGCNDGYVLTDFGLCVLQDCRFGCNDCPPYYDLMSTRSDTYEPGNKGWVREFCQMLPNAYTNVLPKYRGQRQQCGAAGSNNMMRVSGTSSAAPDELQFPWIASIRELPDGPHTGSAFLISSKWLVTTPTAIADKEWGMYVIFGEQTDLYKHRPYSVNTDGYAWETYQPVIHPDYDADAQGAMHAIAVLQSVYEIQFSDEIQPICLMSRGQIMEYSDIHSSNRAYDADDDIYRPKNKFGFWAKDAIIAGWGKTDDSNSDFEDKLRYAEVPIGTSDECNNELSTSGLYNPVWNYLANHHFCTKSDVASPCTGDLGSPVMARLPTGRWVALGVHVWNNCGAEDARGEFTPGIHTNLARYMMWIYQETGVWSDTDNVNVKKVCNSDKVFHNGECVDPICTCENGSPAIGVDICPTPGAAKCLVCNAGFTLSGNGDFTCVPDNCPNGCNGCPAGQDKLNGVCRTLPPGGKQACGNAPSNNFMRVIGGDNAPEKSFPWQVSIRHMNGAHHGCGGAIISNKWVMTAAHCTWHNYNINNFGHVYYVVVGETLKYEGADRGKIYDDVNTDGYMYRTKPVIQHPGYVSPANGGSSNERDDISLLETEIPMVFSDKVQPICIDSPEISELDGVKNPTYFQLDTVLISGWGELQQYNGGNKADHLQYVEVFIREFQSCKNQWYGASNTNIELLESQMCTSTFYGAPCTGDSGGALSFRYPGGQFIAAGLNSFGSQCGKSNMPSVATRVASYAEWIYDTTGVWSDIRSG